MVTNFRTLGFFTLVTLLSPLCAVAQDTPKEVVAAAVRDAGHECNEPKDVVPDANATTPDEKAWIIQCENGRYRVKFKGDRGATVESAPGY